MRPPVSWNFFVEDETMQAPHVLRADAQPNQCYIDGRIDLVMKDIEACGEELRSFFNEEWEHNVESVIEIFRDMHKKEHDEYIDKPRD